MHRLNILINILLFVTYVSALTISSTNHLQSHSQIHEVNRHHMKIKAFHLENNQEETEDQLISNLTSSNFSSTTPVSNISIPLEYADLANHSNLTNLGGSNWILGDIDWQDYVLWRFNFTSHTNVTQCPIDAPYVLVNTTDCEQCPPETPIFILGNDSCVGCPNGWNWNFTSNSCDNVTQPILQNGTNKIYPSFNNTNLEYTDIANHSNLTNLDGSNWILGNITWQDYLIWRFNFSSHTNVTQCAINNPYVLKDRTDCQSCPPETPIFVLANDSCVGCPNGLNWSFTYNNCSNITQKVTNNTNITTPSNTSNVTSPNPQKNATNLPTRANNTNVTLPSNNTNLTNPNLPNVINAPVSKIPPNITSPTILPTDNTTQNASSPTNGTYVQNGTNPTKVGGVYSDFVPQPLIFQCGNSTLACPKGYFLDPVQQECFVCNQIGQYFDYQAVTCLYCPDETPYLSESWTCTICPNGTLINRLDNQCISQ